MNHGVAGGVQEYAQLYTQKKKSSIVVIDNKERFDDYGQNDIQTKPQFKDESNTIEGTTNSIQIRENMSEEGVIKSKITPGAAQAQGFRR